MSKARLFSIAILTAVSVNVYSQAARPDTGKHFPLPSVMGGVGVLYFNGNIGHGTGITAYSTVRGGYTLGLEERPIPLLGIGLDGMIGKLAASERSDTPSDNKNFQSNVFQGDLTINLHFFNKPTAVISPFIFSGISYMSYHTYTDSLSAAGTPYYYWTDGSIRNEPQNAADVITAKIIQRDYSYETSLGSGSALSVPVGVGAKIHLTDNLAVNIQAAYYFSFSKSIEHYTAGNGATNEKYLFSFCSLEYHFGKKKAEQQVDEKRYDNVDFKKITEADTIKNKELTKEQEKDLYDKEAHRDTSAVDRAAAYFANPNAGGGIVTGIDNGVGGHPHDPSKLPARLIPIDYNHDGYITSQEITRAIDEFFDGTSPLTIADINYAIDYFFDQ